VIDQGTGEAIRNLRIKKEVGQEQLAEKMGVSVAFLDSLERGRISATIGIYVKAYGSLDPTFDEAKNFSEVLGHDETKEEMIQDVIELYYGMNLWIFHPELSYEEAINPFIRSLAALTHIS
jgi:transcriptional regulator with XRE-family HTH domain